MADPHPMVKSVKTRPSLSHTSAPAPRASTTARSGGRSYSPREPPGNSARDGSATRVTACLSRAEGVEPRDVPAHDEGMDVVRALVRVDRLQIHHVPDDRMLVHDAGRAQDVAGQARGIERHLHVVPLGHGDLLGPRLAFVLELAQPQAEELRLGDLRDHPHELLLHELEGAYGLAELDALLRVAQRPDRKGVG